MCWLCLLISFNLYAVNSTVDDHAQGSYGDLQGSEKKAMAKYTKCLDTSSKDPCWEQRCVVQFCLDRNFKIDIESGACYDKIRILTQCRKKQEKEEREAREEAERVLKCKDISNDFKMAFVLNDMVRCKEIIWQGKSIFCEWTGYAEKAVCGVDQKQFESAFSAKNDTLCLQILSRSTKCSWFRDAEVRFQKYRGSGTMEAAPPKSLSECMSMEIAFNKAFRNGNKQESAMWLDNSIGCSWHEKASEKFNKKYPSLTIGPAETKEIELAAKKTVPYVKNESLKDAFIILKNAGFILGSPEGGDPAPSKKLVGHVQTTLPAGGQPHYQDKPVVLILYSDIKIPKVVGMTAINALKKLKKAGFSMKSAGCDPPPTKDLSLRAKEQKPAAYAPGKGYDTVEVTFYPPYQNPVAPTITTLETSAARRVLEEMGLSLSFADIPWGEPADNRGQVGTIQKQQPAAGKPIEPGGEVKVWVYYTVVPKVLTMSKTNAESAMKAAWFVPNSTNGEVVKNKNKWGTIYSQTLQPEKKFAKTGVKVTLRVYKKPEKRKKNPYHALLGSWEGYYRYGKKTVNNTHFKILSIETNGNFKARMIWLPKQHKNRYFKGATTSVEGMIKGNNIVFQEIKITKGTGLWGVGKGKNKYAGDWDTNHMTINGKYFLISSKKKWEQSGSFYLKKK